MNNTNMKVDFLFTSIYAFIHFVIDFVCISTTLLCASSVISTTSVIDSFLLIVIYNLVAFALQMPIGAILDYLNKNSKCAIVSVMLVFVGLIIGVSNPVQLGLVAILFVGIGNAIFHCAGGIDVLNIANGRASLPGAFIGAGAMGVFLAAVLVNNADILIISCLLIALLAISFGLLVFLNRTNEKKHYSVNEIFSVQKPPAVVLIAFICFFVTVTIRSYVGMIMAFPWKGEFILAFVAVIAVVCGKAFGGFIADKFGFFKTSVVSLGLAAILFIFSWDIPICGILATFLFNFTMPITLTAMAKVFPQAKGFAFGTATFALSIGFVPVIFSMTMSNPIVLSVLSVFSLIILGVGLKLYESANKSIES